MTSLNEPLDISLPPLPLSGMDEAVLYLRVSDKKQMNTDADYDPEGNSIPTQRRYANTKANDLSVRAIREYVEPGRSATSTAKRPEFQRMMREVKEFKRQGRPIKYVIVYMMSRVFRNVLEELTTKAQLAQLDITLISAKENFGEGYMGEAMQAIMAVFNQLQVQISGDDISTKMENKARNGGTPGKAPLGYLNTRIMIDGREVRVVRLDTDRAPLIRLAFELYATNDYTLADLQDELYDRGLRTRATQRFPSGAVSISKLSRMLRDRYYIGYLTYKGEEYLGRHEPLVDVELFDRVQAIADSRSVADERRRKHHHYLKGSLLCGDCRRTRGMDSRMIIQKSTNRHGTEYTYFFCIANQAGLCHTSHVNVVRLEEAVEAHYAAVGFAPAFIEEVRAHLEQAIAKQQEATRLLHGQLRKQLQEVDVTEDNLLALAADAEINRDKVREQLRNLQARRRRLNTRLQHTAEDLSGAARLIEVALRLLDDPQALYLRCDEEQRRMLNQAIFRALYVEEDRITGQDLQPPFDGLHALQDGHTSGATAEGAHASPSSVEAPSGGGEGFAVPSSVDDLLDSLALGKGSSKASTVDPGQANYNPVQLAAKLEALLHELPALTAPLPQPRKATKKPATAKRLKAQEVEELITAYQAGMNVYKLGERFGITRQTVSAILKRHGVQIRKRGLTEEEIGEAVQLYAQGWSLTRIGQHFEVDVRTVRSRLLEHSIAISTR